MLVVDGNNVMGSRPDGWWKDRAGAARRLVAQLGEWPAEDVIVFFDGAPVADMPSPERVEVRYVGSSDEIRAVIAERTVRAVLVGMVATRRPWPEIVRQLRADDATRGLYVLAFGPHKNLELRARALDAGVDRVVANSAFTRLLPTLLTTPTAAVPDDEDDG